MKTATAQPDSPPKPSAVQQGLTTCRSCAEVFSIELHKCPRCGAPVRVRKMRCVQNTVALLITSIILFIPANILPVTVTYQFGRPSESTIIGGVISLWNYGDYLIASVIFIASVVVPLAKILVLSYLCASVIRQDRKSLVAKTRLFQITEILGKWSMIDVFVVVTLVTLVQVGSLMTIQSGPGIIAFAGVVISTMFAATTFDTRMLWDAQYCDDD